MIICDKCEHCYHKECATSDPRRGIWLCGNCRGEIMQHGFADVTHDFGLMDYLFTNRLPAIAYEQDRITREAQYYTTRGEDLLRKLPQYQGLPGEYRYCVVPAIS